MSVFHLQSYVGLKLLDEAGEQGIDTFSYKVPAMKLAEEEFGPLSKTLFPVARTGDHFGRAMASLLMNKHIKEVDERTYAITEAGQEELKRLDTEYAQTSRPHNGVSIEERQDYLYLKSLTEELEENEDPFNDPMQNMADKLFGKGNHDLHSGLYDAWAAWEELKDSGCVKFTPEAEGSINGENTITEAGLERLSELEEVVAPALVSPPEPAAESGFPTLEGQ